MAARGGGDRSERTVEQEGLVFRIGNSLGMWISRSGEEQGRPVKWDDMVEPESKRMAASLGVGIAVYYECWSI